MIQLTLGGGCHWCTEAVFESLHGVERVKQGWAASVDQYSDFSEAVMLSFDPSKISLSVLLKIHLLTHSSASNHSMRKKYRSAVYVEDSEQASHVEYCLSELQIYFDKPLVIKVLSLKEFKLNTQYQHYYYQDPSREFCQRYIDPKLVLILKRFAKYTKLDKVSAALKV